MEDTILTKQMLNGSADALCQIYHKFKNDMLTVAMSLLCNKYAAEDCVQDVFTQFAAFPEKIQINKSIRGYLLRCVANRAKNIIKHQYIQNKYISAQSKKSAHIKSPAGRLIATEQSIKIFQAMARLPIEQREVITLHLHGEMTFQEIALELGYSINTIQSRYRYGIKKLRTLL